VLAPERIGLVYQVLAGPEMDDDEAATFWSGVGAG
jgi:hypothetical protein